MVRAFSLAAVIVALTACEKKTSSSTEGNPAPADPKPSVAATATASAGETARAMASEPPITSVEASASVRAASATPPKAADSGKANAAARAPQKPVSKHVGGKNFALDIGSPGCQVGVACAMTIRLQPAGEFHINKEYPYKFVATAAPGVEFLGKDAATTFTRAAGDFVSESEKSATMTVRFKPTSAGEANVSGTYKFSVCSADQCQIEQEAVALSIPVM